MSHTDLTLIEEFVKESLELLTQLGDACGQLNTGRADETQLATIDRGLHTLKGNAAALGLKDLSHTASTLLDRWRSEGSATLSLIWRFLADCRRYVVLVGGQRKPRDGFFDHILDPQPVPRAIVKKAPQRLESVALLAPEPSIDEILASVPKLSPDISGLVSKAAQHLKTQSAEAKTGPEQPAAAVATPAAAAPSTTSAATAVATPVAETPEKLPAKTVQLATADPEPVKPLPQPSPSASAPPAPAADPALVANSLIELAADAELLLEESPTMAARAVRPVRPVGQDLSALRSHDVSRQLQSLRRRLANSRVEAPELESALQFLEQLQDGQSTRSRVALRDYIQGAVDNLVQLGEEVGRALEGTVIEHDIQVLEPLAELVRYQLTEILRGRLCMGRIASLEAKVSYTIEANATGDELLIVMRGLGGRPRMSALDRLRLQTSMDFVQDLSGKLRHGDHVGELELTMDIGAVFTSEVCLLETADARFYLPATCVASSGDLHPGSTEIVVRTSSGPRRMKLRSMEERETLLVAAADEELASEGLLGHCLSLRRGERIPLLDPDSL